MNTITKGYFIPYNSKAIHTLRQAQKKLNAQWSVDANECVTITVSTKRVVQLEKMLSSIV
jgi:hypothetical protein